jgi:hypothetical protein
MEAERVSTRLDEEENEDLDVGTETSQPKWGGASLAPEMTKVLEWLRLQAAASQKAATDLQELANAEALELQQATKAVEVSLSMHGESPQAIMAPSVEMVLPPLGLSPTPRNDIDLGLSGEHQLPSSCLLQNLCHQLSLIIVAT